MPTAIYEPKGAAREYAALACNLWRGCTHQCSYCYAPSVLQTDRAAFHACVTPRVGILAALTKDLQKLQAQRAGMPVRGERYPDPNAHVLFCFTSDPYPKVEADLHITRKALDLMAYYRQPVEVLTKSGMRAVTDLGHPAYAVPGSGFGVTLAWANDERRAEHESGAAPVAERIESLRIAHDLGIRTWVSVEPVLDPNEALEAIRLIAPYADKLKIGRWNHDARANAIDWPKFKRDVVALLESFGKDYMLKKGLVEL